MRFSLVYYRVLANGNLHPQVHDPKLGVEINDGLIHNAPDDEERARLFMGHAWNRDNGRFEDRDYRIEEFKEDDKGNFTWRLSYHTKWHVVVAGYQKTGPW